MAVFLDQDLQLEVFPDQVLSLASYLDLVQQLLVPPDQQQPPAVSPSPPQLLDPLQQPHPLPGWASRSASANN